jgi:hypothetical protein
MDWVLCHRCTLIARVRADERERQDVRSNVTRHQVAAATLADLRAKVEGLRDESIWARRGTVAENGLDTVPSAWHNGGTSMADAVLALIDEARP